MDDYIRRRRLKSTRLGVAGGIVLGTYFAVMNHLHCLFPLYGAGLIKLFEELYPWYVPNFWGSFVLFGWGFLDAFFALWTVGTLYNWLTQSGYGCPQWGEKANKSSKNSPVDRSEEP